MKKKKWFKTPQGITAICVMILTVSGLLLKSAKIILIPERVEANEESIIDLKQIIQSQQTINDFYYQREQQQKPYYPNEKIYPNQPVYQEPPRRCWKDGGDGYDYPVDCLTNEWM